MGTPENRQLPWWQWHRRFYNWVLGWADTKFGMLALIGLAITEPICVPIPADVMVIGMSLGKPKRAIRYGLICSVFSVLGGTIAFALGLAIGGDRVIALFQYVHLGEKVALARELYQKYDFWAIAISALTPVPYMLFSWLGGMADVSIKKFVIISIIFRTMRFGSEGVLFRLFGSRARILIDRYFNLATIIVMTLLVIIVFLMKTLRHLFVE